MGEIHGAEQPGGEPGGSMLPVKAMLPVGAARAITDGLALIEEGARLVREASAWALSGRESREAVRSAQAVTSMVGSARLGLVADLDSRAGAVPGARPGMVARTFLVHALRMNPGQAGRDVSAARALSGAGIDAVDPGLPLMAEALAAGELSREHVDAAVRVWTRIPAHVATAVDESGRSGMQRVDAFLAEQSRRFAPKDVDRLAREVLDRVAPDSDRFDPSSVTRRSLTTSVDSTGMLVGRFQLDPAGGAVVRSMLQHLSGPNPVTAGLDDSGQEVLVADTRTKGQRQADALVAAARLATAADASTARAEPAHILVIADPGQVHAAVGTRVPGAGTAAGSAECVQTGPLRPGVLDRLLCDAVLQAATVGPEGDVLRLGRSVRTATRAQRRALAARDRGCARPSCTVPPSGADAHHVTWWSEGGGTDIENLALLCPADHTLVHAGLLEIRMIGGLPYIREPAWIDPHGPPLRNPWPHELGRARRFGEQLRLGLDPRDHDPPQTPDA